MKRINGKTEKEWIGQFIDGLSNGTLLNKYSQWNGLPMIEIFFNKNGDILSDDIVLMLKEIEKTENLSKSLKENLNIDDNWKDDSYVIYTSDLLKLIARLDREDILLVIKALINYIK